jgi:hypothetical protein
MSVIITIRGIEFNVSSKQWQPHIHHFPKVLSFAKVKASDSEQKNPHTDLTGEQIQNLLNKRPVP